MAWSLFRRDYTHTDELSEEIALDFQVANIRVTFNGHAGFDRADIKIIPTASVEEQRERNREASVRDSARAHARTISFKNFPHRRAGTIYAFGPITPALLVHEINNIINRRSDKNGYGDL